MFRHATTVRCIFSFVQYKEVFTKSCSYACLSNFTKNEGKCITQEEEQALNIHQNENVETVEKTIDYNPKLIGSQSDADIFGQLAKEKTIVKGKRRKSFTRKTDFSNTFGLLADEKNQVFEEPIDQKLERLELDYDEEDEKPYIRLSETGRKYSPAHYGRTIEKLAKRGKIYEAVQVLETTMLKEDRVMPNQYVFTTLIGVLGRVGWTHKAFKLYHKMKKMGLEPEDPTYTALFNACANCPTEFDGLQRAKTLHMQLKEKDIEMNRTTYNALIKAYGMRGDLLLAFSTVDEMAEKGLHPNSDTYAQVLIACISDKNAGLKHAIEVWRRMRKKRLQFEIHHYNLLLKAVRDCGVGSPEFANELLKQVDNKQDGLVIEDCKEIENAANKALQSYDQSIITLKVDENVDRGSSAIKDMPAKEAKESPNAIVLEKKHRNWWEYDIPDGTNNQSMTISDNALQRKSSFDISSDSITAFNPVTPNLLNPKSKYHNVIRIGALDSPADRLALLGGLPGILRHMKSDKVEPDVKTYMQLVHLIPNTSTAEESLLHSMMNNKLKPDIGFLNMLIRRRSLRNDYHGSRELLEMAEKFQLAPDIVTYGCLAMGCKRKRNGLALLREMENKAVIPNVEIFDILSYQSYHDFSYKVALLKIMKKLEITPNRKFIDRVENSIRTAKQRIMLLERGSKADEYHYYSTPEFKEGFREFMLYYKKWLLTVGLEKEVHPWDQFKKPANECEMEVPTKK